MPSVISTISLFLDKNSRPRLVLVGITVVAFWVFATWSIGLVPAFGAGFARADDVKGITIHLLDQAIIQARIQYCTAPPGTPVRRYFLSQVNEKLLQYRHITGVSYPLPACEELVLASN